MMVDARSADPIVDVREERVGPRPMLPRGRRVTASTLITIAVSLLVACARIPTTPSVMVLPGSGRTYDEFQADDASCRRSGTQTVEAVKDSTIPSQYRFDMAYMQCMYARGHQVPAPGGRSGYIAPPATAPSDIAPPPAGTPPPAPPGPSR